MFSEQELLKCYEVSSKLFDELVVKNKTPNIWQIGPGEKISDGKPTGKLAIIVSVKRKAPKILLRFLNTPAMPETYEGYPVDVQVSGHIKATTPSYLARLKSSICSLVERVRPFCPGYSIGNPKITAGTCNILYEYEGRKLGGTNWHVGLYFEGKIGDFLIQPGAYDGGKEPDDRVAKVAVCNEDLATLQTASTDFCLWEAIVPFDHRVPIFDAAGNLLGRVEATEFVEPNVGDGTLWTGRTSGTATASLSLKHQDIQVDMGNNKTRYIKDTDMYMPAPKGGDSGSVHLQYDGEPSTEKAVKPVVLGKVTGKVQGALFAGGNNRGYMIAGRSLQTVYPGIKVATGVTPPPEEEWVDFPVEEIAYAETYDRAVGSSTWTVSKQNNLPDGSLPIYRWWSNRQFESEFEMYSKAYLKNGKSFDGPITRFVVKKKEEPPPPPPPPPPEEDEPYPIVELPAPGQEVEPNKDFMVQVRVRKKKKATKGAD